MHKKETKIVGFSNRFLSVEVKEDNRDDEMCSMYIFNLGWIQSLKRIIKAPLISSTDCGYTHLYLCKNEISFPKFFFLTYSKFWCNRIYNQPCYFSHNLVGNTDPKTHICMRHSFRVCDNARTFYRLKLRYNQRVKSARKRLLIIQFFHLGPQVLWQLNMYITNIKTKQNFCLALKSQPLISL